MSEREHPILFTGEMVRAILDGLKTQTRRVVKPRPSWNGARWVWPIPKRAQQAGCSTTSVSASREWHEYMPPGCCPYGVPGDRLWVRETWTYVVLAENEGGPSLRHPDGYPVRPMYRAEAEVEGWHDQVKWSPSIHMPRWVSRLTLEVTGVRVERVQEITEADAMAEGVNGGCLTCGNPDPCGCDDPNPDHRESFIYLWDSINAKRGHSWESNPWVWIVEFEKLTP